MCIDGRIPRRFTVTTYGRHWRIEKVYVDMIAAPKAESPGTKLLEREVAKRLA